MESDDLLHVAYSMCLHRTTTQCGKAGAARAVSGGTRRRHVEDSIWWGRGFDMVGTRRARPMIRLYDATREHDLANITNISKIRAPRPPRDARRATPCARDRRGPTGAAATRREHATLDRLRSSRSSRTSDTLYVIIFCSSSFSDYDFGQQYDRNKIWLFPRRSRPKPKPGQHNSATRTRPDRKPSPPQRTADRTTPYRSMNATGQSDHLRSPRASLFPIHLPKICRIHQSGGTSCTMRPLEGTDTKVNNANKTQECHLGMQI